MIKVLHISKYYPPFKGGIEAVAYNVVSALKKDGNYQQYVFCFNEEKDTKKDTIDGVPVFRVGSQKKISSQAINIKYGTYLVKIFDEFKPDIIHFHYPNPFACHFLLKLLKKKKFKGKLIVHYHCDIIKQRMLKRFFIKQTKDLLDRADVILATSPAYLKDTDFLPNYKEKVKVLPLCIGNERTHITDEQKNKAKEIRNLYVQKKIVFFFGRHTEYKGLQYLIDSDQYLDQNKVQIVIAGKGELTEGLKEKSKKYSNIVFVGRLSEDDINSYLMACDIFAFPSITRNEAFGISLAEAMYFGKPACTFTIPGSGVNWVCRNNEEGLEAPNRDVKAYARNVTKLINDNKIYNMLSDNARIRSTLFIQSCFSSNILNIYFDLSKGDIK